MPCFPLSVSAPPGLPFSLTVTLLFGDVMAERSRNGSDARFDIEQILLDAKCGWLPSSDIYYTLQNYESVRSHISISDRPPVRPPSGSVFLFNRRHQKHFREDGHNWRKKKDRKTVSESHENLQVRGTSALKCYYAKGEENENFRRRIYWMLSRENSHIVLVHYLEVYRRDADGIPNSQGPEENIPNPMDLYFDGFPNSQGTEENVSNPMDNPVYGNQASPGFHYSGHESLSLTTTYYPNSASGGQRNELPNPDVPVGDFGSHSPDLELHCQVNTRERIGSPEDVDEVRSTCKFGDKGAPATFVADGVLQCHTPLHEAGRVPFYVRCNNGSARSEEHAFEFLNSSHRDEHLFKRLVKLLGNSETVVPSTAEISKLYDKITALLKDPEWEQMLITCDRVEVSKNEVQDKVTIRYLKNNLRNWLIIQKFDKGGEGLNILDEGGQGILHLAAALDYDWAIQPTIVAGVSINFQDENGWTALHWAAYCGRERMVGSLISHGADPELLTYPTPTFESGRTPADLAFSNGHREIAGNLRSLALSSHHAAPMMTDSEESDGREKAVGTVSEQIATPLGCRDLPHGHARRRLRLQKSLCFGMHRTSNEHVLSLPALETKRAAEQPDDAVRAAAIRIQCEFRSWKGRKDFLLIRQHIIKIQAHVRGQQARKNYGKIWFDRRLDEIISCLRKGRGLSASKPEVLAAGSGMDDTETEDDDYDFLTEGSATRS